MSFEIKLVLRFGFNMNILKTISIFILVGICFFSFGKNETALASPIPNVLKEIIEIFPSFEKPTEIELKKKALLEVIDFKLKALNHSKDLFEEFLNSSSTQEGFSFSTSSSEFLKDLAVSSLDFVNSEIEFYSDQRDALKNSFSLEEIDGLKNGILIHQEAIKKRLGKEPLKKSTKNLTEIFDNKKIIEIASRRLKEIKKDLNSLKNFPKIELLENLLKLSDGQIVFAKNLLKKEVLLFVFKHSLDKKEIKDVQLNEIKEKLKKIGIENFSLEDDSDLNSISFQIQELIDDVYGNFEAMAEIVD